MACAPECTDLIFNTQHFPILADNNIDGVLYGVLDMRVGFYTGSFDPCTIGHRTIIESAVHELQLDRLHVVVNWGGSSKDYNASLRQRSALLSRMMTGRLPENVLKVHEEPIRGKDALIGDLTFEGSNNEYVQIIGEDSFASLPEHVRRRESPKLAVVSRPTDHGASHSISTTGAILLTLPAEYGAISSTQARAKLVNGESSPFLDGAVNGWILDHHLYMPPDPTNVPIKEAEYRNAFELFLSKMTEVMPLIARTTIEPPPFKATQSREAWIDKFIRHVAKQCQMTPDFADLFAQAARQIFSEDF